MDPSDNNDKLTFERALFLALSSSDMLLPTNDDQVSEFENEIGTPQTVPGQFSNPDIFLPIDNVRTLESTSQEDLDAYNLKVASSQEDQTEGGDSEV